MAAETNAVAASPVRTSRVGKRPIDLPKGVSVSVKESTDGVSAEVKGPKGTLTRTFSTGVKVAVANNQVTVTSDAEDAPRLQGTARAHLANMIKGAAEGYTKTLELVGTGYRAEAKGNVLHMALGLSHPVIFPLPGDIKAQIPADSKGTVIILTGSDKDVMGQAAATIRSFRPPEPYGGKGVRYKGEAVRRKAGKASAKGGKGGKKLRAPRWQSLKVAIAGSCASARRSRALSSVRGCRCSARRGTSTRRSSTTRPARRWLTPAPSPRSSRAPSARRTRARRPASSAVTSPSCARTRTSPAWCSTGTATCTTVGWWRLPTVPARASWTF